MKQEKENAKEVAILVPSRANGNVTKKATKSLKGTSGLMSMEERGELLGKHLENNMLEFTCDDRIEAINN